MAALQIGFADWNRRDFNAFVRAAEKYGRHALKEIASEIDGKTEEQVRGMTFFPCVCVVGNMRADRPRVSLPSAVHPQPAC